jgi:hypothetical protein
MWKTVMFLWFCIMQSSWNNKLYYWLILVLLSIINYAIIKMLVNLSRFYPNLNFSTNISNNPQFKISLKSSEGWCFSCGLKEGRTHINGEMYNCVLQHWDHARKIVCQLFTEICISESKNVIPVSKSCWVQSNRYDDQLSLL